MTFDVDAFKSAQIEARAACAKWSAELVKNFGKAAGDKRYLPAGKGDPGSALRAAAAEFHRASEVLNAKWAEYRGEQRRA